MEKIKNYVATLFKDVNESKNVKELEEELSANLIDKYNDLIKNGVKEDKAYKEVISSIGNIDDLLMTCEQKENFEMNNTNLRNKKAKVISGCVGLYIFSLIALITTEELELPDFVVICSFFMIAGLATCILIYYCISLPKYKKNDETMVENFKKWSNEKENFKEIKGAINLIIWTLTIIIYFLLSFLTNAWYITWIMFLLAFLVEEIISLIMKVRGK